MKTDELIAVLATHAGPAPRAAVARRLAPATAIGVLASWRLGELDAGAADPRARGRPGGARRWLLIKLGYAAALGAAAAWLTGRLSVSVQPCHLDAAQLSAATALPALR